MLCKGMTEGSWAPWKINTPTMICLCPGMQKPSKHFIKAKTEPKQANLY